MCIEELLKTCINYSHIKFVGRNNIMINTKTNYNSIKEIKKFIASAGYSEVINYSFYEPGALEMFAKKSNIKLLNPLTTEQSAMRTVILPSVLENLKRNLNNQAGEVKIFEISKTYYQNRNGIEERQKLCLAASVELESELWDKRKYDFFDLKNLLAGFRIPESNICAGRGEDFPVS